MLHQEPSLDVLGGIRERADYKRTAEGVTNKGCKLVPSEQEEEPERQGVMKTEMLLSRITNGFSDAKPKDHQFTLLAVSAIFYFFALI